jgi:hypothetical protein
LQIILKYYNKTKHYSQLHNTCNVDFKTLKNRIMKAENRKKNDLKNTILKNNLMMRFIRGIEREEQLDSQVLKTMLAYQRIR